MLKDREWHDGADGFDQINLTPGIHVFDRGTDFIDPVPKLKRGGYADPGDAINLISGQTGNDVIDRFPDKPANTIRCRILIGFAFGCAY